MSGSLQRNSLAHDYDLQNEAGERILLEAHAKSGGVSGVAKSLVDGFHNTMSAISSYFNDNETREPPDKFDI